MSIPVFGSGDCIEPEDIVDRMRLGRERRVRGPRRAAQSVDSGAGPRPDRRPACRAGHRAERGRFLLDYIDLLLSDHDEEAQGFRHLAHGSSARPEASHERWVINKLRALCTWYTKGFESGSHLRIAVNSAKTIAGLESLIHEFFLSDRVHAGAR